MSAPVHFTAQQVAKMAGVSRRSLFQAIAVRRYGCPELIQTADSGQLPIKHCETLAKALSHDEQREFLTEMPTMTPRYRRDLLALLRGEVLYQWNAAKAAKKATKGGIGVRS